MSSERERRPPRSSPTTVSSTENAQNNDSKQIKMNSNSLDISLEVQGKDLNVSGFSRAGPGHHGGGPPGGVFYEKAKSRHRRHREVYKSSADGKAVVEEAVPLGRRDDNGRVLGRDGIDSGGKSSLKRKMLLLNATRKQNDAHKKKKTLVMQKKNQNAMGGRGTDTLQSTTSNGGDGNKEQVPKQP
mmetsp:Transcript_11621/g.24793  ORF Transcript_11621/g.24793 Transcript_11621/m.24793 type:complete len:186 (-) Transcript_11621:162-719(-)|eukprot:CAMPEP_0183729764 /NCGR_PEP_ID=MMETSP0737-20130205/31158_1 /TAXON_ID=385413 /ORGANISM="Thalassiosira miniscula, Strain CCMP1093" /LENGTH=185 /DNA_ID=CAMNT_0025962045 /DNA_START=105 /DNA_END=662 /DNA_ORIENTATION=+